MAKTPKGSENTKEIPGLLIRTQGVKSFCRAGHRFGEQPIIIALELLTKEQVKALKAEKRLRVEEVSVPVDAISDDSAEA